MFDTDNRSQGRVVPPEAARIEKAANGCGCSRLFDRIGRSLVESNAAVDRQEKLMALRDLLARNPDVAQILDLIKALGF